MWLREGLPITIQTRDANRRIFFKNGMLEFIWVANAAEIKSQETAPTHLWERSCWQESGFSPFGIGLCAAKMNDDVAKPPVRRILPIHQPISRAA